MGSYYCLCLIFIELINIILSYNHSWLILSIILKQFNNIPVKNKLIIFYLFIAKFPLSLQSEMKTRNFKYFFEQSNSQQNSCAEKLPLRNSKKPI
ncbi:hypothetical protein Palpr_0481 [Paludibacter propionicigenes WB4]|uniref:Uncharacterized protein n=1 Tax=Paludibacter propionicigenes (strain DSM 17365 / JCM 13257 / WB4) TaxID=694427 RepID=E4T1P6_PALPW|nr:hypothetical protein Palpr_0481 [Paludibacter propionicigenes WB4]